MRFVADNIASRIAIMRTGKWDSSESLIRVLSFNDTTITKAALNAECDPTSNTLKK